MTGHWLQAPAAQVCRRLAVDADERLTATCARCGQHLRDGSPVSALVGRAEGGAFRVERLVCVRCPVGAVTTLGVCALAVEGVLGVLQQAGRQFSELVVCDVAVTRMSPVREGSREAWRERCRCRAARRASVKRGETDDQ